MCQVGNNTYSAPGCVGDKPSPSSTAGPAWHHPGRCLRFGPIVPQGPTRRQRRQCECHQRPLPVKTTQRPALQRQIPPSAFAAGFSSERLIFNLSGLPGRAKAWTEQPRNEPRGEPQAWTTCEAQRLHTQRALPCAPKASQRGHRHRRTGAARGGGGRDTGRLGLRSQEHGPRPRLPAGPTRRMWGARRIRAGQERPPHFSACLLPASPSGQNLLGLPMRGRAPELINSMMLGSKGSSKLQNVLKLEQ